MYEIEKKWIKYYDNNIKKKRVEERLLRPITNNNRQQVRMINEFILDRYNYHAKIMLNDNDMNINNFPEIIMKQLLEGTVVELLMTVFGKKQEKDIKLKTPKTWFNWTKIKYRNCKWMRWIINRYPIKYNYHNFKINKWVTFPNLDIPLNMINKLNISFYNHETE